MANSQKDVSGQKTKRYRPKKNVQEKTKLKIVTPRYSARKNLPVTGNSKSSSQKKKPKKSKVSPATEGGSDYYDDDDAQSIFQSSVQDLVQEERNEPKRFLEFGDYIHRESFGAGSMMEGIVSRPSLPWQKFENSDELAEIQPESIPTRHTPKWPNVPALSEKSSSSMANKYFFQPCDWSGSVYSLDEKIGKSTKDLDDLDMTDPCVPERPCVLCKMSIGNNCLSMIPCYEQPYL